MGLHHDDYAHYLGRHRKVQDRQRHKHPNRYSWSNISLKVSDAYRRLLLILSGTTLFHLAEHLQQLSPHLMVLLMVIRKTVENSRDFRVTPKKTSAHCHMAYSSVAPFNNAN